MLGLGSILGTGVFVSLGIAAGIAGSAVLLAIPIAAMVAMFNGLSSAQLAASHPVAGGTYEYGYRYLTPSAGFTAGWLFVFAKSASAATAALGCAGYLLHLGANGPAVGMAIAAVVLVGVVVVGGIRRSNVVNIVIVSVTIVALLAFTGAGLGRGSFDGVLAWDGDVPGVLHASALVFVAYTGYGRIATLGEEVMDPARVIPIAIVVTLATSMLLYLGVAVAAVGTVGAEQFAEVTSTRVAPLAEISHDLGGSWLPRLLQVGALTAMLGVLLNLLLGLSRVILAMARRADLPRPLARLDETGTTPRTAVIVAILVVAGLVVIGDVRTTWSLSAFMVLCYYGLTNLAALRLPREQRRFPRWVAVCGLVSCAALAVQVDRVAWITGLAVIAGGLVWHAVARRLRA
jgi:APA family basic amino acid/polyamine antiporter